MTDAAKTSSESRPWADALALAVLFVLAWIPFVIRIMDGLTALSDPLAHDVGLQWIPFRIFISAALHAGVFPLWADQVFAGFPFAAFSHTGVFYPLGALLLLGDYARMVNYFYPVHLCIAGAGVFVLGRRLGLGPAAAWFAALAYVFTGKPFYFIHFLPATCSNAWTPWFLASSVAVLRRGRFSDLMLAAVFLALQVLGGDVESTSYGLLFGGLFLAVVYKTCGGSPRRAAAVLFALALGLFICLVQLLPLMEYSTHFIRNQGVTFSYFSRRLLPPSLIWGALLPVAGAGAKAGAGLSAPFFYLGLLTWGMAGLAVWKKSGASPRLLGLLALFAFAWSFGSIPFLDRVQFLLPVLGRFGSPEQAFFMGQLFLALLAGAGVQWLLSEDARRPAAPVLIVLVLAIAALVIGHVYFELLSSFSSALAVLLVFSGGALFAAVLTFVRPGIAGRLAVAVVCILQAFDLLGLAFAFLPANRPEDFAYSPGLEKIADHIRPDHARYIFVSKEGPTDRVLLYHAGLALNIDGLDGWITVPPRSFAEVLALADHRAAAWKDGKLDHLGINSDLRDAGFIDAPSMPILDLLSLRFIIDRGLLLKFSSPVFLFTSPPEMISTPEGKGSAVQITPRGGITAPLFSSFSYRIYVHDGDMLELDKPFTPSGASAADCFILVQARLGGVTTELEKLAITRGMPGIINKSTIDLSARAGHDIELIFSLTGPPGLSDIRVAISSPVINNPAKPIQLIGSFSECKNGKVVSDIEGGFYFFCEDMDYNVKNEDYIDVYENRDALPRAFVVHQAETIADPGARLERLAAASRYEFSKKVFLDREAPDVAGEGSGIYAGLVESASLASRRSGEEVYQVESRGPGLLFVSDQYYPGWKAYVRGREVPILCADHAFRAVPVPGGSSVVRMVFEPASFRVGLFVSMASLLFAMVVLGSKMRPKRRPASGLSVSAND